MKKIVSLSVCLVLSISLISSCGFSDPSDTPEPSEFLNTSVMSSENSSQVSQVTSGLEIGDYLLLGSYYDEPILWRCVDIDENGPLMLSDKILCLKAFDSPGDHVYPDGTAQIEQEDNGRTLNGSNLWETSNIRAWLNSTASSGEVIWPDGCPPSDDKFYEGKNAYADEKGFLAEGNFTVTERDAIRAVSQKAILAGLDKDKLSEAGSVEYNWMPGIDKVVSNYDQAYSHNVEDAVFLLDVKQVNRVWMNSGLLGENYYFGKPTEKAVLNDDYKSEGFSAENYWYYWLRTPLPSGTNVLKVFTDGRINDFGAGSGQMGVRPAFYFATEKFDDLSGDGSAESPFGT